MTRAHPSPLRLPGALLLAAALLLTSLATPACDPLADGTWRGEALHIVSGWVNLAMTPDEVERLGYLETLDEGELRAAVFWAPTRGSTYSLATALEQDVGALATFPARFQLSLYQPPPATMLRELPAGAGQGQYAAAMVVAYLDKNGNGRWDRESERLVGGANDRFIVYTPGGLSGSVFGDLAPGFHRLVPDRSCERDQRISYLPDPRELVVLHVGSVFPAQITLTLDCGGERLEWAGACPPLHTVAASCVDADPAALGGERALMCEACTRQLAPPDADILTCRAWLLECGLRLPAHECEREWRRCVAAADGPSDAITGTEPTPRPSDDRDPPDDPLDPDGSGDPRDPDPRDPDPRDPDPHDPDDPKDPVDDPRDPGDAEPTRPTSDDTPDTDSSGPLPPPDDGAALNQCQREYERCLDAHPDSARLCRDRWEACVRRATGETPG